VCPRPSSSSPGEVRGGGVAGGQRPQRQSARHDPSPSMACRRSHPRSFQLVLGAVVCTSGARNEQAFESEPGRTLLLVLRRLIVRRLRDGPASPSAQERATCRAGRPTRTRKRPATKPRSGERRLLRARGWRRSHRRAVALLRRSGRAAMTKAEVAPSEQRAVPSCTRLSGLCVTRLAPARALRSS